MQLLNHSVLLIKLSFIAKLSTSLFCVLFFMKVLCFRSKTSVNSSEDIDDDDSTFPEPTPTINLLKQFREKWQQELSTDLPETVNLDNTDVSIENGSISKEQLDEDKV